MAYFAKIDSNNVVVKVVRVPKDQEHRGQAYLRSDLKMSGKWIQTSFNGTIRGSFAGVGMKYCPDRDIFLYPSPFPSWEINEAGEWQAPIPRPDFPCIWDESTVSWVQVEPIEENEEIIV